MAKEIDGKLLKGLKFRGAEGKKVKDKDSGVEKVKHTPFERDLKPGDVLDWKDNGASVTIVTADGQKYVVSKDSKDSKEGGK